MDRIWKTDLLNKKRKSLALLTALLVTAIWSSSFVIVKFGLGNPWPSHYCRVKVFRSGLLPWLPFCCRGGAKTNQFRKNCGPAWY